MIPTNILQPLNNLTFDEQWYLKKYPAVYKMTKNYPYKPPNGYQHYITIGKNKGYEYKLLTSEQIAIKKKRRDEFDENFYKQQGNWATKKHYLNHGESEQRLWKHPNKLTEEEKFEFLKETLQWWPEAVHAEYVCKDTNEDKYDRAEGIIDFIELDLDLENKSFLDFGCGEGHVANKAKNISSIALGYDILKQGDLEWEENSVLTTDFEKVKSYAPYDIILLYDVVDHLKQLTIKELFIIIKNLLSKDGRIFIRLHPWCARHGAHLYKKINKPFLNVIFSDEQLKILGYETESLLRLNPLEYKDLFNETELQIETYNISEEYIDDFVRDMYFSPLLKNIFQEKLGTKWREITQISWVDCILK